MFKKNSVRLICLIMCLFLVVSIFAGCKKSKEDDKSSTSGTTKEGETTKTTEEVKTTEEPPLDLNKRVIKILLYPDVMKAFKDEEGDYYQSLKDTEKRFNCTFEFTEKPTLEVIDIVTQAHLANEAPFDVAMVEGYHATPTYAISKEYLNISDHVEFSKFPEWDYSPIKNVGVFRGSRYAFPIGVGSDMGIFYNKAMVRKAGLEDPWKYVENNTWNFETFKKFASDLTIKGNDGVPTQYGFVSEEPFYQFAIANGGNVIDLSSGEGKFALGDDKGVGAIDYVMSLYDEKIMPTPEEIAEYGIVKPFDGIPSGKVAMFPYGSAYGPYLVDEVKFKNDDVGWIYFPKGPKATEYTAPTLAPQNMLMVLAHVEKPEEICRATADLMAIWSETRSEKKTFETLREEATTKDANIDFLVGNHKTMYLNLADKVVCTNTYSYNAADTVIKEMIYEIRTKSMTSAAAIDSFKDRIQNEITSHETIK